MDDIEYEILALVKDANDKNHSITYTDINRKQGRSLYEILGLVQSLVEHRLLDCDSKTTVSPQGNLTLTKKGKRVYRKEYKLRNQTPVNKWLAVIIAILTMVTPIVLDKIITDVWPWAKTLIKALLHIQ